MINFNSISTWSGLFYALRFGNRVYCSFFFSFNVYLGSHGKQHGGRKGGRTQGRVNGSPNLVLGGRIPRVNGQDLIVRSRNYSCLYFRAASMDDNKTQPSKDYHDSHSKHMSKPYRPSHGWKRGTSYWGWVSGPSVPKISYRTQTKTKITKI